MFYFLTHRSLWKPFLSKLGPLLTLSVSVVAGMFTFTYIPQLGFLLIFNGPLAVVSTILLILSESAAIITGIARGWLLQDAILDTFDATLVSRNATAIVSEGRELKTGSDPMAKLGKILKSPFAKFSPKAMVRYFIYLPLNFIPVVGTVVFIYLQGRSRGRSVHDRVCLRFYGACLQLLTEVVLPIEEVDQQPAQLLARETPWTIHLVSAIMLMRDRNTDLARFGLVATVLEMVPIANIFFTYTNTGTVSETHSHFWGGISANRNSRCCFVGC